MFCILIVLAVTELHQISLVQSVSHVQLFAKPCTAACQASMSITNSQSLPKLIFIHSVIPSNNLILCCPLLFLPSIFHSRWPKYCRYSFSISPSSKYSGLISFRIDWCIIIFPLYRLEKFSI